MPKRSREILDVAQLCRHLRNDGVATYAVALTPDHVLDVTIRNDPKRIHVTAKVHECFHLIAKKSSNVSELNTLLLPGKEYCANELDWNAKTGLGTALLKFADAINMCLGVETCELTNVATFGPHEADCVYAKEHHGLGWYMSHGYLIRSETLSDAVFHSNKVIEKWNEFWNQVVDGARMRREESSLEPCFSAPVMTKQSDQVKYYHHDVRIYVPSNRLAPAVITIGAPDPERLQRLESFDYRQGARAYYDYSQMVTQGATDLPRLTAGLQAAYPVQMPAEALHQQVVSDLKQ